MAEMSYDPKTGIMSYKIDYDPNKPHWSLVKQVELTDECIDKIAEAVVQKLRAEQTEPQTEDWHDDCNTCRWQEDNACTIPCCDYEPQTDCRRCKHYATGKCKECFGHELFTDSGYATDCSWK